MSESATEGGAVDVAEPNGPEAEVAAHFGVPASFSRGQLVLHPPRQDWADLAERLRGEGFVMCTDVTAVDYLDAEQHRSLPDGVEPERFEVIAGFINHRARTRIRMRTQIPHSDPTCPTLWHSYATAENLEREVFDLFGITFDGHPDMTRILLPEEWQGHPLRKDYAMGRIPVQFKGAAS